MEKSSPFSADDDNKLGSTHVDVIGTCKSMNQAADKTPAGALVRAFILLYVLYCSWPSEESHCHAGRDRDRDEEGVYVCMRKRARRDVCCSMNMYPLFPLYPCIYPLMNWEGVIDTIHCSRRLSIALL